MLTPVKRQQVVRWGAWFVLVAALLPNISYMGHWPAMSARAHNEGAAHTTHDSNNSSTSADHIAHCHVGPAHCGGGESMIGTPFVGETLEGIALPGSERVADSTAAVVALSGHAQRFLQPPRAA